MNNKKILPWMVLGLVALMWVPMGSAHGGNHGTVKVHDEADADPDMRNEPHVDCTFWVEGFNMHDSSGELVFYGWPPTGNMSVVMTAPWNGTPEADGDGFHFLAGPFTLDSGHYRVEAFSTAGHPGGHDHFSKTKTFWVVCETEQPGCPPIDIQAVANEDGSVLVSWDAEGDVNLYRAVGAGEFEFVGTFGNGTYLDTDTTAGTTYTYAVTLFDGETESPFCAQVEVTAIPVFPTFVAAAMAMAAMALAYVGLRRQ